MMKIQWHDSGKEPQCPPDPSYPKGIDVDIGVEPSCYVAVPYPAVRIGHYVIECENCGVSISLTTAGRPDDPRSIKIPCKMKGTA